MSETTFTPGPWRASRDNWRGDPDPHRIYISGNFYEHHPEDDEEPGDGRPCTVATAVAIVEGNATSGGVTAANARLISLAPEMLAELRRLEWVDPPEGSCPRCFADKHEGHAPDCTLAAILARADPA